MSRRVLKKKFIIEDDADELADAKCPPKQIPSSNLSHKSLTSRMHHHHLPYKYEYQGEDDVTMEEGVLEEAEDRKCPPHLVHSKNPSEPNEEAVLFDEEEMIKGGAFGHDLESEPNKLSMNKDDRNTARRTFGGQPDYSLGAEKPNMQEWHCPNATEEKPRRRTGEFVSPGAFQEGGPDLEEGYADDEFTLTNEEEREEQAPVVIPEKSIDPVSAELVNTEEEERRLEEKINQALERERQKAVVAEVAPVNDDNLSQSDAHKFGTRKRDWFVIGAILLIIVAITTALAMTLPQEPSNCGKDGYFGPNCDLYYPNCSVMNPELIGNGYCDGKQFNKKECDWDGGDCVGCNTGEYVGPRCDFYLPFCNVRSPEYIGDGTCDGLPYNMTWCAWDGGDCLPCPGGDCSPCDDGYFGPNCDLYYPNCNVNNPRLIGDGLCESQLFNTEECGWDGGDCIGCNNGYFGPHCDLEYPNCSGIDPLLVQFPMLIGDGLCEGWPFNTEKCGWDGGDCIRCNNDGYFGLYCDLEYPNCSVPNPAWIGDGYCDFLKPYYMEECGWDGGDCCAPDDSSPICKVTGYPNCSVPFIAYIGDGHCDGEPYNVEECGWDGGDCIRCNNDGYLGPSCDLDYPNCSVLNPAWIGDGHCDGEPYYTEECGWDGGDCCAPDDSRPICEVTGYPNCSVPDPGRIGNGWCDVEPYNVEECGWDGGDCIRCNSDGYFGPYCDLHYPNCSVPVPARIGNYWCDGYPYYTEECGWDGGDCCAPDDSRPICEVTGYPNCSVPYPAFIGDGWCDVEPYNVEECGWDGGDCIRCNNDGYFGPSCDLNYPNCSVPNPGWIGDYVCDGLPYDVEQCGWDGGDCPH